MARPPTSQNRQMKDPHVALGQRLIAAIHSSIRSRSTSQYLNDDNSNLSIPSIRPDSSSSIGSGQDAPERLLDFSGVRRNLGVSQPLHPVLLLPSIFPSHPQCAGRDVLRNYRRNRSAALGGRRPSRYCASNARRASATVRPIPMIPSSTLGPRSATQSSPRINNRGR